MPENPWYIRLLDKLGVNTTRLRWRLYQREQQTKNLVHSGGPSGLRWMQYEHKICSSCHAVNDRESRTCSSCGRPLPSMLGYRISRLFRTIVPAEGPVVTTVFLSLIVLFYIIEYAANRFAMSSLMQPSMGSLYVLGAFSASWGVGEGQYWRFLSFGLIHGSVIHFGFIAYALYQIGALVEMQLDRSKMLALVTLTQFSAAFASYLWYGLVQGYPDAPTVGGSGWLYGLMGFGIAYFHQMGPGGRPMRDSLLRWAVIWLVLGFVISGINNAAHIGGLIAGLGFAYIPEGNMRRGRQSDAIWAVVYWACFAAWCATLFFMARSVVVYWPELMSM